jgi:hypothetical protein
MKGTCQKCGTMNVDITDANVCIWCEDTVELKLDGDDGFKIIREKQLANRFCTQCGRGKKWIDMITSRFWGCPKCG